jgi:hypothetical protein
MRSRVLLSMKPAGLVIVAVAARFAMRSDLARTGVAALVVLGLALVLATTAARTSASSLAPCLALTAAVAFFEVGLRVAASRDLFEIAGIDLSQSDRLRLLHIQSTREELLRGLFALGAPLLVVLAAILARLQRREQLRVSLSLTWTAPAAAMAQLVLVVSSNPLRWTGAMRPVEAIKLGLQRLSPDGAGAALERGTWKYLPAPLRGPVTTVDAAATLHLVAWQEPDDPNGSAAPLLRVSPGLPLGQLLHALEPSLAAGRRSFRWLTGDVGRTANEGAYAPINWLRQSNFRSANIELDSNLPVDAGSGVDAGMSTWLAVLPDVAAAVPSDPMAAVLVALVRTETGYRIGRIRVEHRELWDVRAGENRASGDSAIIASYPDTPADIVALAAGIMAGNGFRTIVVSMRRDAIEHAVAGAYAALARAAHAASAESRSAFEAVVAKQPEIGRESLEFIEGALIATERGSLKNALRIEDCDAQTQASARCHDRHGRFAVDFESGGVAVSKRTGAVGYTWHGSPMRTSVSVTGGSISDAERVVARMRPAFRACYNDTLKSNPDVFGSVRISAQVGARGEVRSATPSASDLPPAVVACVVRRVKTGHFEPPQGAHATVTFPVTFVLQR